MRMTGSARRPCGWTKSSITYAGSGPRLFRTASATLTLPAWLQPASTSNWRVTKHPDAMAWEHASLYASVRENVRAAGGTIRWPTDGYAPLSGMNDREFAQTAEA